MLYLVMFLRYEAMALHLETCMYVSESFVVVMLTFENSSPALSHFVVRSSRERVTFAALHHVYILLFMSLSVKNIHNVQLKRCCRKYGYNAVPLSVSVPV